MAQFQHNFVLCCLRCQNSRDNCWCKGGFVQESRRPSGWGQPPRDTYAAPALFGGRTFGRGTSWNRRGYRQNWQLISVCTSLRADCWRLGNCASKLPLLWFPGMVGGFLKLREAWLMFYKTAEESTEEVWSLSSFQNVELGPLTQNAEDTLSEISSAQYTIID